MGAAAFVPEPQLMRHVAIASVVIIISASLGISMVRAQSPSPKPKYPGEIAAVSKLRAEKNASVSGAVRVPMLNLDFLRRYDLGDMLMLAASVVVVVSILIAI
jgi:hypothetical protein